MSKERAKSAVAALVNQSVGVAAAPIRYSPETVVITLQEVRITTLRARHCWRSLHAYFTLSVDEKDVFSSERADNTTDPVWRFEKPLGCKVYPSSVLKFTVHRHSKVRGEQTIGELEAPLCVLLGSGDKRHPLTSDDSPDSHIAVSMQADLNFDYLSYGLATAAGRLADVQNRHSAPGILSSVMDSIRMLGVFAQHLTKAHPILRVATVLLAAVYKTLTVRSEVDAEIKSLAKAMRDLLEDAIKYKGPKLSEDCIRDIICLVMEWTSLMDDWSRRPSILKPRNASDCLAKVKKCEKRLIELRGTFSVVLNLGKLDDGLAQIGIQMDGQFADVHSKLAEIVSLLTEMCNENRAQANLKTLVSMGVCYDGHITTTAGVVY